MSLSSPFSPWLGTNYTPSTSEVSQISAFLEEPRRELVALNDEVDLALRALNALLAKQAKLKQHIEAHEALTHPIRRLPDELLVEIFHQCLPALHRPVMSSASAPLILTRVCHPWRSLALSTPTLWSSLHIPIPKGRDELDHLAVTDARGEGVKWWLANAKDAPLSISLYWPPALLYAYDTECQLLRTALEYSRRIRVLELDLPDSVLLEVFYHDDPQDLPALEKVILRLPAPPDRRTRGLQISHAHLWKSPVIDSLVWESVDDDFFKLPLNWNRMKEITIDADPMIPLSYVSPLDAHALISATPNLQRLRLELTIYDQSRSRVPEGFPATDSAFITMNHLTHLDLTDVSLDPDIETNFLQNLQLPELTSLSYNFMGLNPFLPSSWPATALPRPMHPLLAFLHAQDKVIIKYFKVGGTSIPRDAFLECLRLMPLLEKLYVTDPRLLSDEDDDYDDEYGVDVREPVSDEEGPDGRGFLSLDELLAAHEAQLLDQTGLAVVVDYSSPPDRKRSRRRLEDEERYERSRALSARQREIRPDDDLLKAFVPCEVWWKTTWDDMTWRQSREKGKGKEKETAMDIADSVYGDALWWNGSPMVTESRGGGVSDQADDDIDMFSEGDDDVLEGNPALTSAPAVHTPPSDPSDLPTTPPTARPSRIDPAFLAASQSDALSLRMLPLLSDPREPAGGSLPPEPLEDADPPGSSGPGAAADAIRIPIPIPVDTTDLAAEEREVLCPRLTSLRFDRARFTVTVLRTFIKARIALSQTSEGKDRVKGWQAVEVEKGDSVSAGEETLDEARADADGESAGFFTARTSPSGASSRIGLSREASTSATDGSVPPEVPNPIQQQSSPHLGPRTNQGAAVAALQHIHAWIMYGQPRLDIPPHRTSRKYTSRLAAEMSDEFDVRVILRFASAPTLNSSSLHQVWGGADDTNSDRAATGTPRWVEGRTIDGDEGQPLGHPVDGQGEGSQRRVGVMTVANDARVGVRGWRGPGSVYEERDGAEVWEW